MKLHRKLIPGILMNLLLAGSALAVGTPSAQDPVITINPVVRQFPVTAIGNSSTPAEFTITNLSGGDLAIGTIDIGGANPDDFVIAGEDCTPTLTANSSCIVSVSFRPDDKGTKGALLRIASGSASTPVLGAYLTNSSSADVEAQQRMPPVLSAVSIPETMTVGTTYSLTWTLEGYDASYKSYAVMFDCTGITDNSCGNSYGDLTRFAESDELTPTSTTAGNWSYSGVTSKAFTFTWDFTPQTRKGGTAFATSPDATDVVVRFYQKSDIDAARQNSSVSLLIPGKQASIYYDTVGRRILKKISVIP